MLESYYPVRIGDFVTFHDGQEATVTETNGNMFSFSASGLNLQPYIHGYPTKLSIRSSTSKSLEMIAEDASKSLGTGSVVANEY
jgi:hypothetical protein